MTLRYAITMAAALLLASCGSPPAKKLDPDLKRSLSLADSAYTSGGGPRAAEHFRDALLRARTMDNAPEIAFAAYNLAACLAALGRYEEARPFLEEAKTEYARNGEPAPDVALLKAKVAQYQGSLDEAQALALAALQDTGQSLDPARKAQFHILLAQIAAERNDAVRLKAEWSALEPMLRKITTHSVLAEAQVVRACVASRDGAHREAGEALDAAAEHFKQASRFRDMAFMLRDAGAAYEKAGANELAADRYFRAARSMYSMGEAADAREIVKKAIPLAGGDTLQALERLYAEITADAGKSAAGGESDSQ